MTRRFKNKDYFGLPGAVEVCAIEGVQDFLAIEVLASLVGVLKCSDCFQSVVLGDLKCGLGIGRGYKPNEFLHSGLDLCEVCGG